MAKQEVITISKRYKLNHQIKAQKLRIITESGKNLGVIDKTDALKKARSQDLDLVLIAEEARPPVAKILDFNKFLYEQNKKEQKAKAGSKTSELKEFRFGPTIDDGDLKTRIRRSEKWIKEGNKVKISIQMRGRELAHPEIAYKKIETVTKELEEVARPEKEPQRKGNKIEVTYIRK